MFDHLCSNLSFEFRFLVNSSEFVDLEDLLAGH